MRPRVPIPAKPSAREIARSNATSLRMGRCAPPPRVAEGTAPSGWRWWITRHPFDAGVLAVMAERVGAEGEPVRLGEEFRTREECQVWVNKLTP